MELDAPDGLQPLDSQERIRRQLELFKLRKELEKSKAKGQKSLPRAPTREGGGGVGPADVVALQPVSLPVEPVRRPSASDSSASSSAVYKDRAATAGVLNTTTAAPLPPHPVATASAVAAPRTTTATALTATRKPEARVPAAPSAVAPAASSSTVPPSVSSSSAATASKKQTVTAAPAASTSAATATTAARSAASQPSRPPSSTSASASAAAPALSKTKGVAAPSAGGATLPAKPRRGSQPAVTQRQVGTVPHVRAGNGSAKASSSLAAAATTTAAAAGQTSASAGVGPRKTKPVPKTQSVGVQCPDPDEEWNLGRKLKELLKEAERHVSTEDEYRRLQQCVHAVDVVLFSGISIGYSHERMTTPALHRISDAVVRAGDPDDALKPSAVPVQTAVDETQDAPQPVVPESPIPSPPKLSLTSRVMLEDAKEDTREQIDEDPAAATEPADATHIDILRSAADYLHRTSIAPAAEEPTINLPMRQFEKSAADDQSFDLAAERAPEFLMDVSIDNGSSALDDSREMQATKEAERPLPAFANFEIAPRSKGNGHRKSAFVAPVAMDTSDEDDDDEDLEVEEQENGGRNITKMNGVEPSQASVGAAAIFGAQAQPKGDDGQDHGTQRDEVTEKSGDDAREGGKQTSLNHRSSRVSFGFTRFSGPVVEMIEPEPVRRGVQFNTYREEPQTRDDYYDDAEDEDDDSDRTPSKPAVSAAVSVADDKMESDDDEEDPEVSFTVQSTSLSHYHSASVTDKGQEVIDGLKRPIAYSSRADQVLDADEHAKENRPIDDFEDVVPATPSVAPSNRVSKGTPHPRRSDNVMQIVEMLGNVNLDGIETPLVKEETKKAHLARFPNGAVDSESSTFTVLTPRRANKKEKEALGVETVLTSARRSMRLLKEQTNTPLGAMASKNATPSKFEVPLAPKDPETRKEVARLLEENGLAYVPNKELDAVVSTQTPRESAKMLETFRAIRAKSVGKFGGTTGLTTKEPRMDNGLQGATSMAKTDLDAAAAKTGAGGAGGGADAVSSTSRVRGRRATVAADPRGYSSLPKATPRVRKAVVDLEFRKEADK
ncbi:hypothetical protein DFJ73DRAFT_838281 [Zopfochytrium polystomum]|nr:hypothetical protein DFJ73DRAFT_838281 [Zopfochytrium polystomum]